MRVVIKVGTSLIAPGGQIVFSTDASGRIYREMNT